VRSFGNNADGQLGDGTLESSAAAVHVAGVTGAVAVSAGSYHSLALLGDGSIVGWGNNAAGQLGDGTRVSRPSAAPAQLTSPATAVAAGDGHSLALLRDGSVLQCGNVAVDEGEATGYDLTFHDVGLGEPATAVDAGSHSLAVLAGGSVASWGANSFGQLGDGTRHARAIAKVVGGMSGARRAVAVAAGTSQSVTLLENGSLLTWGDPFDEPTPLPLDDVVSVSAGLSMSVALLGEGRVFAWGSNVGGQLAAVRCHRGPSLGLCPPPPASPRATASLEGLARPSVRLYGQPGIPARLGGTKLGGRPDLPLDMAWPTIEGTPQAFVAQVDLAEVMDALRTMHPEIEARSGLLTFFCDSAFRIRGEDRSELGCEVLGIPPGTAIGPRDFPDALPQEWRHLELPLGAEAELMNVPVDAWEVEQSGVDHQQIWAWGERNGYPEDRRHRMFGYPEPVQNEPRQWSDEILLLQVDADPDAGMDWGDVGRVFYLIRRDDLGASVFSRVQLVFQCH